MPALRRVLSSILKTTCLFALTCACGASFVLTYAYISGDRIDREEMKITADHYANFMRAAPTAEASNNRAPASVTSASLLSKNP